MLCYRLSSLDGSTVQTLQVALPYIPRSELGSIMEILAAQILSSPQENITKVMG